MKTIVQFLLVMLPLFCFGQRQKIDSLINLIENQAISDSQQINILHDLSIIYYDAQISVDSSLLYANASSNLATKTDNLEGQARAAYNLAYIYDVEGKSAVALDKYLKAKEYYLKLEDHEWVASCIDGMASSYYFRGEYDNALKYYFEALEYEEEHDLIREKSNTLINIGIIYRSTDKYDEAIEIYKQNVVIRSQLKDSAELVNLYNNIGVAYTFKEDYVNALKYLDTCLILSKIMGNQFFTGIAQVSIGDLKLKAGYPAMESRTSLEKGYQNLMGLNANSYRAKACLFLGELSIVENKNEEANRWFYKGLKEINQTDLEDIRMDLFFGLTKGYEKLNQIDSAFYYQKKYQTLNAELLSKEKVNAIEEMQTKYETKQKEQEIDLLNTKNELVSLALVESKRRALYLGLGFFSFLIVSYLLYRLYRKIQKQNTVISSTLADKNQLISQLNEAREQIIRSEKMAGIGQFTAGVAHELNNPINYIHNLSSALKLNLNDLKIFYNKISSYDGSSTKWQEIEILKETLNFPELSKETDELIQGIQNGSERSKRIIKSLQFLSYADQSKKSQINLHDSLDSSIELILSNYKDNIFIIKKYGELDLMSCFPSQINQLFLNILTNAAQSIDGEGEIEIHTSRKNNSAVISIKDNGKGFGQDVKEKMFEPFYTTKEVGRGLGLGLSICHAIVENHNGKIEVESRPGKGSNFTIFLPYF